MIDASNAGVPSRMWRDLDEFNLISKYDISYSHKINSLRQINYGLGAIKINSFKYCLITTALSSSVTIQMKF